MFGGLKNRLKHMNNISILKIFKQLGCLLMIAIVIVSCSDWTDVRPIEIKQEDFSTTNPEAYEAYLKDLRAYKASNHHTVLGWYDNTVKVPFNQSHLISKVPDSLDYVVLKSPDGLSSSELSQIKESQDKRAIKFLYDVDFDFYINAYGQFTLAQQADISLLDYLTQEVSKVKDLSSKFPYDGVVMSYTGKDTLHMSKTQKELEKAVQQYFMSIANDWITANSGKEFLYKGNPQSLYDKSVLAKSKYIILPTLKLISKVGFSFTLSTVIDTNVPTDKFIVMANTVSYKPEDMDLKVGYFTDGTPSITGSSEWILSTLGSDIEVKGLGIENLQYDYFNIIKSYKLSREAINTLNPSIKN